MDACVHIIYKSTIESIRSSSLRKLSRSSQIASTFSIKIVITTRVKSKARSIFTGTSSQKTRKAKQSLPKMRSRPKRKSARKSWGSERGMLTLLERTLSPLHLRWNVRSLSTKFYSRRIRCREEEVTSVLSTLSPVETIQIMLRQSGRDGTSRIRGWLACQRLMRQELKKIRS